MYEIEKEHDLINNLMMTRIKAKWKTYIFCNPAHAGERYYRKQIDDGRDLEQK